MGFISLFLTVTEEHIPHICISKTMAAHFRPCETTKNDHTEEAHICEKQVSGILTHNHFFQLINALQI